MSQIVERCRASIMGHVPAEARAWVYDIKTRYGDSPGPAMHRLLECDGWYLIYHGVGLPGDFMEDEGYQADTELSNLEFDLWATLFGAFDMPECKNRVLEIKETGL